MEVFCDREKDGDRANWVNHRKINQSEGDKLCRQSDHRKFMKNTLQLVTKNDWLQSFDIKFGRGKFVLLAPSTYQSAV
tara:strand:- start:307 stop:540 length:234 start_codon:yes stop_codon:yes gene_type:complete